MKGLKTYFTYLHRNKLFTLVNVAGLGISLMSVSYAHLTLPTT